MFHRPRKARCGRVALHVSLYRFIDGMSTEYCQEKCFSLPQTCAHHLAYYFILLLLMNSSQSIVMVWLNW